MTQQLGDREYESGDTITVTFDGAVDAGDFVEFNGDRQVTVASSRADAVAADTYADGDNGTVVLHGVVKANVASSGSAGQEIDGLTSGQADTFAASGSEGHLVLTAPNADDEAYVDLE